MSDVQRKIENIGVITSLIIGLPIGLTTVALTFVTPTAMSGEGLPTMGLVAVYGKAIVGLIAPFVFSLWHAGRKIPFNLENGDGILKTSFKYSLTVNKIIWAVFIVLTLSQNFGLFSLLFLIPPIIAFLISVGLTTISIGLLISWIVDQRIKQLRKSVIS